VSTAKKAIKGVSIYNQAKAFDGYTLIVPEGGYNTWLINMKGEICFHWDMRMQSLFAKLLNNGHLLYFGEGEGESDAPTIIQHDLKENITIELSMLDMANLIEIDDNSKIVWSYKKPGMTHDFYRMENGNTVILHYVKMPKELKRKVKSGIDLGDDIDMWTEAVI